MEIGIYHPISEIDEIEGVLPEQSKNCLILSLHRRWANNSSDVVVSILEEERVSVVGAAQNYARPRNRTIHGKGQHRLKGVDARRWRRRRKSTGVIDQRDHDSEGYFRST